MASNATIQHASKDEATFMGLILRYEGDLLESWSARGTDYFITHKGVRDVLRVAVELWDAGTYTIASLLDALPSRGLQSEWPEVSRIIAGSDYRKLGHRCAIQAYSDLVDTLDSLWHESNR